jgi:hypothetical protein
MKNGLIVCTMLALFPCDWAFGQQPTSKSGESHKYRTLFTLAGGGGGFTVGLVAGLAAFDDAINSDRKVWTTAVLSAVGGAVGGYFLGRALDKRQKKTNVTWVPGEIEWSLMRSQSFLRDNESMDSWPGARLASFSGSFSAGHRLGIDQANAHVISSWDLNYLYLVSQLQRIDRAKGPTCSNGTGLPPSVSANRAPSANKASSGGVSRVWDR